MSRNLTPPMSSIPIGTAVFNGQRIDVQQHPEFVRFFFDLFARVGGVRGMTVEELLALLLGEPKTDPRTHEALRAVDELRIELDSLRSSNQKLSALVEELAGQIEPAPSLRPIEQRVKQIEDRLQ